MIVLYILSAIFALLLLYILFLGVCSLLVSPEKEYENHSSFYRFLLDTASAAALKLLRIRIHISGAEQLHEHQRMLFVCNHRSNFDPIVTWVVLRKWKIAFVSKPENFQIPFFGRIIRRCCFLPIDRESPRKALSTLNQAAHLLQKQEVSIGIYPEGTRSKTCELLPFHNGVFKIAQKAAADIAVLSISGTEQIHRNIPFRKTDVYLDVLGVISAEAIKGLRTDAVGADVKQMIEINLETRKL